MFKPCRPSIHQSAYLEIAALSRPLYLMSLGHGAAEQCAIYRKGCVTFKRQKTETKMRWRKISLGFATLCLCLVELTAALSNEAVFEAQFLNVSEELKIADERYGGYEIIEHRVSHRSTVHHPTSISHFDEFQEVDRVWYNVSISREEISPFSWKELKTGNELDMNAEGPAGQHIFEAS